MERSTITKHCPLLGLCKRKTSKIIKLDMLISKVVVWFQIPVGYQAQTGQVLVAMPMVNPAHMSPQPVQGMPPSAPYGWQGAPADMASPPSAPYVWQGAPADMASPPSAPYGWQGAPAAYAENPVSYEGNSAHVYFSFISWYLWNCF